MPYVLCKFFPPKISNLLCNSQSTGPGDNMSYWLENIERRLLLCSRLTNVSKYRLL